MNVTIPSSFGPGSGTLAGKGCATLFMSVFAIMGAVFLVLVGREGWKTVRTYSWVKTDCVIEASSVREKGDGASFDVRFRYRFAGRDYTGTRYVIGMSSSQTEVAAERLVQRYPAGRPAYCYVNATAPEESTLERGSLWFLLFGLIPLIFIAVGVGGMIGVWRAKPASATPVSERHRGSPRSALGVRLFGLIFVLIGGGLMYVMLLRPMLKESAAANWPRVPCEILSSKVARHSGNKGSTYSLDVRYRYSIGGKEYTGTQYNFDTGNSSNRGWRDDAVAALPPGTKTLCYVNPEDPLEAVLSMKGSPDRWFGLIPAVFLVVGLLIFVKGPAAARRSVVVPLATAGSGVVPSIARGATGEVELRQATPPGCAFAGIAIFALIWNGFVWFMVAQMKGEGWGPHLFITIFVLAGIAMAGVAFYLFLALFNPRPVLTVSAPSVPLGGSLDVRWRFTGNVRRLVKLTISLRAREEATYRRGTTTTTDKSVFVDAALLDTADRTQMAGGSVKVNIPRDLMHTFTATNNKVVWLLSVHGDIPRWPDVNAEFPIAVLPRETATLFHEQPPAP